MDYDLIITILPVVTKDLPISPRFTPYNFFSRCKFSTLTTRQPMVEFYLLKFPRFPLRKKEHKSYFGKNRTHDFRTSRCAGYLLDHSGDAPGLSTIELPCVLAESGVCIMVFVCTHPIERCCALPCFPRHDNSVPCLSRATTSRRAPNWNSEEAHLVNTILNQPYRRRITTDRLNREDSQLGAPLEGGSGPTPVGKTLPHSYPKIRFRREGGRARYIYTEVYARRPSGIVGYLHTC